MSISRHWHTRNLSQDLACPAFDTCDLARLLDCTKSLHTCDNWQISIYLNCGEGHVRVNRRTSTFFWYCAAVCSYVSRGNTHRRAAAYYDANFCTVSEISLSKRLAIPMSC